jgi:hypothetical protein
MIKLRSASALQVSYDELADVLYLSLGTPVRDDRMVDGPDGLVWRVTSVGSTRGATVFDFHDYWLAKDLDLAGILAAGFGVPEIAVREQLPA